jgi:hypothetical protein
MEGDTIEVIQHLKREINASQREAAVANDQLKEVHVMSIALITAIGRLYMCASLSNERSY